MEQAGMSVQQVVSTWDVAPDSLGFLPFLQKYACQKQTNKNGAHPAEQCEADPTAAYNLINIFRCTHNKAKKKNKNQL